MDITIADNGDGTFTLQDADATTLRAARLLTPNFNGGTDTVIWNDPFGLNDNRVFDPVAEVNAIQKKIDDLTDEMTPLQNTTAYQQAVAKISTPMSENTAQPAQ